MLGQLLLLQVVDELLVLAVFGDGFLKRVALYLSRLAPVEGMKCGPMQCVTRAAPLLFVTAVH